MEVVCQTQKTTTLPPLLQNFHPLVGKFNARMKQHKVILFESSGLTQYFNNVGTV
jgi:hypothetical protein